MDDLQQMLQYIQSRDDTNNIYILKQWATTRLQNHYWWSSQLRSGNCDGPIVKSHNVLVHAQQSREPVCCVACAVHNVVPYLRRVLILIHDTHRDTTAHSFSLTFFFLSLQRSE